MNRLKTFTVNASKGVLIGVGAIIPGLSGGTIAMITGVFEDLLKSFTNLPRRPKHELAFLMPFAIGGTISVIIFSPLLDFICSTYPRFSNIMFCVISLYSLFAFTNKCIDKKVTVKKSISAVLGFCIALLITYIMNTNEQIFEQNSLIFIFFVGFPLAAALVLPAISFSYMMLFFGVYDDLLKSITNLDFRFLFVLFVGISVGCYAFSKMLLSLLSKYQQETYSFVLGFVLCSMINIIL